MAVKCVENRHDAPMWDTDVICSQHLAQGGPATVQIYTKTGLWGAFPNKPAREGPPAYKSIPKLASGRHFPAGGPGRARQRTNLYDKWPLGPVSQQAAQGGPASVQIYTKTGLRKAFPSRWPREAPPPYKSIRKVASGEHFPANGPGGALQRISYIIIVNIYNYSKIGEQF